MFSYFLEKIQNWSKHIGFSMLLYVLVTDAKIFSCRCKCPKWFARYSSEENEPSTMDGKKVTEAETKDLAAQGMDHPRQMRTLELTLYLGRPVGGSELENGSYRSPASSYKGATLAKKGGDLVTIDTILKRTLDDGKRDHLDDWFSDLQQLLAEQDDPDSKLVSDRVSETIANLVGF